MRDKLIKALYARAREYDRPLTVDEQAQCFIDALPSILNAEKMAKDMAFASRHALDASTNADDHWSNTPDDYRAFWVHAAETAIMSALSTVGGA